MYKQINHPTPEAAVEHSARMITAWLEQAIESRGSASLVVSGGQSPVPLFERLNATTLHWPKITVTLADERWVPFEHDDSNERLVHQHLLKNRAESALFIPLKNDAATPKQGVRLTEHALQVLPAQLDVVVLGMGMDGHTLSWFPQSQQLANLMSPQTRARCGYADPTNALHPRISLTYRWVSNARELLLYLSTEEKTRRFKDIVEDPASQLPTAILARDPDVRLTVVGVDGNAA